MLVKVQQKKGSCYNNLSQQEKVVVEYVWIGQQQMEIRSKARVYNSKVETLDDVEDWIACNYEKGRGDKKKCKTGKDQEVILHPIAIFRDPFRGGANKIVLCETLDPDTKTAAKQNTRRGCFQIMQEAQNFETLFKIEQQYTIMTQTGWPLGFKAFKSAPKPQGFYYCSIDAQNCIGRAIMEKHLKACLYAGLKIRGANAEVFPGQWAFQIGTTQGLEVADHLWMARYILSRIAEQHSLVISYHPKPISGNWNGSGALVTFSTKQMREENGLQEIMGIIDKLEVSHQKHMFVYGISNEERLINNCPSQNQNQFSFGASSHSSSIRIPTKTLQNKQGFIEDRRPAANVDPYVVTAQLVDTICLDGQQYANMHQKYREISLEWEDSIFQKKSYFGILDQSTLGSIGKINSMIQNSNTIECISTQSTLIEL